MTRKRTGSSEAAPVTGVATGSLGTGSNLDDTQILETADLAPAKPGVLDDEADLAAAAPEPPPAPAATPRTAANADLAPVKTSPATRMPRSRPQPIDRRRGLALAGAGALGMLVVLAGAGMLSQLDFGASGAEPTSPEVVVSTPLPTATPPPKQEADKGKGNCSGQGRGRHCRSGGDGGGGGDD